jgi:hypothetical protein
MIFPAVAGSMTSSDGQVFMLRARCEDGTELMLGFPHREIANIVENAAMQLAHGRDDDGQALRTAFNTTGFQLGRGPKGETVLTLTVGEAGNISFILPTDMAKQLHETLGKLQVRH